MLSAASTEEKIILIYDGKTVFLHFFHTADMSDCGSSPDDASASFDDDDDDFPDAEPDAACEPMSEAIAQVQRVIESERSAARAEAERAAAERAAQAERAVQALQERERARVLHRRILSWQDMHASTIENVRLGALLRQHGCATEFVPMVHMPSLIRAIERHKGPYDIRTDLLAALRGGGLSFPEANRHRNTVWRTQVATAFVHVAGLHSNHGRDAISLRNARLAALQRLAGGSHAGRQRGTLVDFQQSRQLLRTLQKLGFQHGLPWDFPFGRMVLEALGRVDSPQVATADLRRRVGPPLAAHLGRARARSLRAVSAGELLVLAGRVERVHAGIEIALAWAEDPLCLTWSGRDGRRALMHMRSMGLKGAAVVNPHKLEMLALALDSRQPVGPAPASDAADAAVPTTLEDLGTLVNTLSGKQLAEGTPLSQLDLRIGEMIEVRWEIVADAEGAGEIVADAEGAGEVGAGPSGGQRPSSKPPKLPTSLAPPGCATLLSTALRRRRAVCASWRAAHYGMHWTRPGCRIARISQRRIARRMNELQFA